jgi:hypothetical protein
MKALSLLASLFLLLSVGCSKDQTIPGDHGNENALKNKAFFEQVGALQLANPNGFYAEKLQTCVYANTSDKSCVIKDLPLIGMTTATITVNDILDRTLYTHAFMLTAFKEVLQRLNPEVLQMFGSVNAIVLSNKVNPSFYLSYSGAIYLSGNYFWSNYDEWKVSNEAKDPRASYGIDLQFSTDFDFVRNKKSINDRASSSTKTYDEMVMPLSRLFFHELTHANDFFPRSLYSGSSLDARKTYQKIAFERFSSDSLVSSKQPSHLSSSRLWRLGDILYHGETPTAEDKNLLAVEVADEFKNEKAVDMYAFSTEREDLAMSAESMLMKYYYDVSRFIVFIKYPHADFVPPKDYDYPIVWGQKDRVLVPEIKERALYAVENDLGTAIRGRVEEKIKGQGPIEIPALTPWDDIYNL